MKTKIFLTGSAGFVGSHLLPTLLDQNYIVTALVKNNPEKKLIKQKVEITVGDLSEKGEWMKSVKNSDVVIHLAAEIASKSLDSFEKNNVIATRNLIESAKKYKVKKIILFSSAAVTSIRKDWYAQTKMEQEKIVTSSKIPYSILRPSMIYGPGDTKNIGWLIKFVKKNPIIPLPGGGNFGRQPIYVKDLCQIVLTLITRKENNKIYEIHGKEYVTMKKMVTIISKNLNQKKTFIYIPIPFLKAGVYINQLIFPNPKFTLDQIKSLISGEKFKGEKWWETFDIIPTTFDEGVLQMIKK